MNKKQFLERYKNIGALFQEKVEFSCSTDWIVQIFPQIVFSNASTDFPTTVHVPHKNHKVTTLQDFPWNTISTNPLILDEENISIEDKIINILSHSRFRKGSINIFLKHESVFRQKISQAILLGKPVSMVVPTLPFQNQNPLCTGQAIDHVDISLGLMFAQLRDVILSVEHIYKPGLKIILLCDGVVYADFFGNSEKNKIQSFRMGCEKVAKHLGLAGKVECVDMSWIIDQISLFATVRDDIRDKLTSIFDERKDLDFVEAVRSLERGMIFNLPFDGLSSEEVVDLANTKLDDLPQNVKEQLRSVTIRYASFLLAMSLLGVVNKVFPNSLRGTVHAKDAPQVALHLIDKKSSVFPYHGVTLISLKKLLRTGNFRDASRVVRLCELPQDGDIIKIVIEGKEDAFAYLETT